MKNIKMSLMIAITLLFGLLASGQTRNNPVRVNAMTAIEANDLEIGSVDNSESGQVFEVDEAVVFQNRIKRDATAWHLEKVHSSITKGKRVYKGTITKKAGTTIALSYSAFGFKFSVGASHSVSGKFKHYYQYATAHITGQKIENGSGHNLGAFSSTANIGYDVYVAI
ncbi:hypothetical protein [Lapidilactobacillus salsurivasis]